MYDTNLQTDLGEPLTISEPGIQNTVSGPDFTNSKIKVGEQTWFGNVEIHVKSSDWKKHGHSDDKAYDSIILHVVYEKDCELEELVFRKIPTLELRGFIDKDFLIRYQSFVSQTNWISCQDSLPKVNSFIVDSWLDRLSIERVERKTKQIGLLLEYFKGNWEKTFLTWLSSCFGFKTNSLPFELIGKALEPKYLVNSENIEALLLGVSGLLPAVSNDFYVNEIRRIFDYERVKWDIQPLKSSIWKKGGIRPYNSPELRIAQLAAILSNIKNRLFTKFLEIESLKEMNAFLKAEPSDYWNTHFSFNSTNHAHHNSGLSASSRHLLIVNGVVPFLFFYGKTLGKQELQQRALGFLEDIPGERNSIIQKWNGLGIQSKTAFKSQALLELYNEYCCVKKCLICSIGNKVLLK